jgi:hypothetical protein
MRLCNILFLLLFVFPLAAQEKTSGQTYLLQWRFVPGLYHVYDQSTVTEVSRYALDDEMKPLPEKVHWSKASVNAAMHWQIEEITAEQNILVAIHFKKGVMKFQGNNGKEILRLEDPLDRQKAQQPPFADFAASGMNGLSFLLDQRQETVLATWQLQESSGGLYQKILRQDGPDPLGLSYAYRILPGKAVPVGHTWRFSRTDLNFTYDYQYQFLKITSYRERNVAHISGNHLIKVGGREIGSEHGDYFFDYRRGLMVAERLKKTKQTNFTLQPDKNTPATVFMEETVVASKSELANTNAS